MARRTVTKSSILQNDIKTVKALKITLISVVAIEILGGFASLFIGAHAYMFCFCAWVFGGLSVAVFHGIPTIGIKSSILLFFAGMAVSLFFEAMGANFGIFFSKYVYTSFFPGPKLFGFNIISMVGYGFATYFVFAVSQCVLGQYDGRFRKGDVILLPFIAALLLVSIDFATDPLFATITGAYIWEEHGVYCGIPWQNYMGWYLMAYSLYQIVTLTIWAESKKGRLPAKPTAAKKRWFWASLPALFASLYLQFPFYPFISNSYAVTNGAGQTYLTSDIYWCVFIICTGAVLTPGLILFIRTLRATELED